MTLVCLAALAACEPEAVREGTERVAGDVAAASRAASAARGDEAVGLFCQRTDEDEALTVAGAGRVDIPGVSASNSARRCVKVLGVDAGIAGVRDFYRSALDELGYEIEHWEEAGGIARGNLSRTFVRARKPGRVVQLTIDEFDPDQTAVASHRIHAAVQIDEVGG